MLTINKITSHSAVDYAPEELKKCLRMMNPNGGDVKITYDPAVTERYFDYELAIQMMLRIAHAKYVPPVQF